MEISSSAPAFAQRTVKGFANFHFNMKGGYYTHDRRDAFDSIDKNCVVYCEKPLGRRNTWKQMA